MNIHITPSTQSEQASFEQNQPFEHPALTLVHKVIRPTFAQIELVGVFIGLASVFALLKLGLGIYRLMIDPFSFPNLDLP